MEFVVCHVLNQTLSHHYLVSRKEKKERVDDRVDSLLQKTLCQHSTHNDTTYNLVHQIFLILGFHEHWLNKLHKEVNIEH